MKKCSKVEVTRQKTFQVSFVPLTALHQSQLDALPMGYGKLVMTRAILICKDNDNIKMLNNAK